LQRVLQACVRYAGEGIFDPTIGGTYPVSKLGEAHHSLETRQTMGKIAVYWE
jgi:NADPH:quinone reductase-like Zn-dependent oxidoreductase